jgi:hypothetical protein
LFHSLAGEADMLERAIFSCGPGLISEFAEAVLARNASGATRRIFFIGVPLI